MKPTQNIKERLIKHTTKDPTTGCWNWSKSKTAYGYGIIKVAGKVELAHRVSFSIFKGPLTLPCVCHICDNPSCINPDHLFNGTNLDNIHDKVSKGRQGRAGQRKGEKHSLAKLTEQDVLLIRASPLKQKELAALYKTTQSNISLIKHKRNWSHI